MFLEEQEEQYRLSGWEDLQENQMLGVYTKPFLRLPQSHRKRVVPLFPKASSSSNLRKCRGKYLKSTSNDVSCLRNQLPPQKQIEAQINLRKSQLKQQYNYNHAEVQKPQRKPKTQHKCHKSNQVQVHTSNLQSRSHYLSKFTLFSNLKINRIAKQTQNVQKQVKNLRKQPQCRTEKRFVIPQQIDKQGLSQVRQQRKIYTKQSSYNRIKLPLYLLNQQNYQPKRHNYTFNWKQKRNSKCLLSKIDNTISS